VRAVAASDEEEEDGWARYAERPVSEPTVTLFRPVGPVELRLIETSGFRRFPPRLPEQPIFYPVCNHPYAVEIAHRWNTRDGGGGFVTRFGVRGDVISRYERHVVGARHHEEYWIPAEDLDRFNDGIVGTIEVIGAYPPATVQDAERDAWFDQFAHMFVKRRPTIGPCRCPCCRLLTLSRRGEYQICPVCYWEDDDQDDADADVVRGGPNKGLSLTQARANYARIGASDEAWLENVRPPTDEERR
jgi:hypothetical protein